MTIEKSESDCYRAEYEIVRGILLNTRMDSIHFKSAGLPYSFPHTSDDLDVLIKSNHEQNAEELLQKLGHVQSTRGGTMVEKETGLRD